MPGRESNMGLPHSRRTRYFLSWAASLPELRRTLAELRRTLAELRRTLAELRRTLAELRRTLAELQSTLSELRRTLFDPGTPQPTELRPGLLSYAAAY